MWGYVFRRVVGSGYRSGYTKAYKGAQRTRRTKRARGGYDLTSAPYLKR
jgi:hypothetical protein